MNRGNTELVFQLWVKQLTPTKSDQMFLIKKLISLLVCGSVQLEVKADRWEAARRLHNHRRGGTVCERVVGSRSSSAQVSSPARPWDPASGRQAFWTRGKHVCEMLLLYIHHVVGSFDPLTLPGIEHVSGLCLVPEGIRPVTPEMCYGPLRCAERHRGGNLKQEVFTFCWCSCQPGRVPASDKVTTGRTGAELWAGRRVARRVALSGGKLIFLLLMWKEVKHVSKHAADTENSREHDSGDVQVKVRRDVWAPIGLSCFIWVFTLCLCCHGDAYWYVCSMHSNLTTSAKCTQMFNLDVKEKELWQKLFPTKFALNV